MNIRNEIRLRMERLKISRSELARRLSLPFSQVSQFLTGTRGMSIENLNRALAELDAIEIRWDQRRR